MATTSQLLAGRERIALWAVRVIDTASPACILTHWGTSIYGSETPTLVRKLSGESEGRKVSVPKAHAEERSVSTFGDDLIQALNEALAHAKGEGPTMVHTPVTPREVRKQAKLTQAQMAPLMGMSLSGYRKWEQGTRRVSGPAAALLRLIKKEPEAVRRALLASSRDDH